MTGASPALLALPRLPAGKPLPVERVDAATLVRVSTHDTGEPHFGKHRSRRFDDPRDPMEYGVCYGGTSFEVAIGETVLHREVADANGEFMLDPARIAQFFVVRFVPAELRLVTCYGVALKAMGGTGELSTVVPYDIPQAWSRAFWEHPDQPDGILYVSRHINNGLAVALFDRCAPRVHTNDVRKLLSEPKTLPVLAALHVRWS